MLMFNAAKWSHNCDPKNSPKRKKQPSVLRLQDENKKKSEYLWKYEQACMQKWKMHFLKGHLYSALVSPDGV